MEAFIRARDNDINYFLKSPIYLDIQDDQGQTLLHYAIRGSADEMIVYLLSNHINVNLKNKRGETPLFEAINKGKMDYIIKIIERFADINIENIHNETALHLAIKKGNLDIVKLLIENGADIFKVNKRGQSLLFYSIESGNVELFEYVKTLSPMLIKKDELDNTLLHWACRFGTKKMVKHLLKHNENPHIKNNLLETPLFESVKKGDLETLELLIEYGGYIDVLNKYNQSLLELSKIYDNVDITNYLTYHKSSLLYKRNIEKNPLRHAVVTKDLDKVNYLIYMGTKAIKDKYNMLPLDYAKRDNSVEIIKLL